MPEPYPSTSIDRSSPPLLLETGRFIQENKLIGSSDRVLCMVSGGADSAAMVRILHWLSGSADDSFPHGFSLGICHINYGCRGQASDADEDFVRRLGEELRIPVHSIRAPSVERSNFQAWARDFRYLAAQNLCRWQGYTRIAVGHNRDDRVETFIYRLITYSGRRSLAVMPPRKGKIIRPLLFLTAAEIREHCAAGGIAYRQDESNLKLDYRRNRIRHQVMPRLEEIRPDFRDRIEDTINLLQDEEAALDNITDQAWLDAVADEDGDELAASAISLLDRAIARLVVRRWLTAKGAQERMTRRVLDAIVDLCGDSSGTQSLSLPGGLKVERQYDRLLLKGAETKRFAPPAPVDLPVPGAVDYGDYRIEASESNGLEIPTADSMRVTIDAESIISPLQVRPWFPGDRFAPLGLGGTKSLQDFFTDEKVPAAERNRIPIIASGESIVWICGMRISEDFKVTSRSQHIIELKAVRRDIENPV